MRQTKIKPAVLFILLIITVMGTRPLLSMANPDQFEVIIKVNYDGFFDSNGKALNNLLEVPKERNIKLIFEHVGKPGEEHAFSLLFDSGEEISSDTISNLNKRAYIEFSTGNAGESYDVFCVIVDCDGMEHLTDLVLIST